MNQRPLLRIVGERARPLSDAELDRIPTTTRVDARGLSRAAKETYSARRRNGAGSTGKSFVHPDTLESQLRFSRATRQRADAELVTKGYLERVSGRDRKYPGSRHPEYWLVKPAPAQQLAPQNEPQNEAQNAALEPQNAAPLIEGKEQVREEPQPSAEGSSPRIELAAPVADDRWEPEDVRRRTAAEMRRWKADRFGLAAVSTKPAGPGACSDCKLYSDQRQRLGDGRAELCPGCVVARHPSAMRAAAAIEQAERGRA